MDKPTGWKYYVPDDGEVVSDATEISAYNGIIWDADDAARIAADEIWHNRDGWECGIDLTDHVVIIDPNGTETHWDTYYEASVDCYARPPTS